MTVRSRNIDWYIGRYGALLILPSRSTASTLVKIFATLTYEVLTEEEQ